MSEELKKQREQQASQEQLITAKVAEATAQLTREHEAALQNAVADATANTKVGMQDAASLNADTSAQPHPDMETIIQQHKQELVDLEARLTQKYEAELKSQKESTSADAVPEAVENIVKERMEAFQKEHEQKLTDAIERGRREVNMKLKLKDGQLAKALSGKKELEDQTKILMEQLTAAGITPSAAPTTSSTTTTVPTTPGIKPQGPPATPTTAPAPPAAPSLTPATPRVPTPVAPVAPPAAAPGPSTLPPKPSTTVVPVSKALAGAAGQAIHAVRGAARGRGRGVSIRGGAAAAAQGVGRGGGVLAQVNSAAAASPSGTSILGAAAAAAKRPREESETSPPDPQSLAKRMRGTPPVTLQRNRHLPSTDTPQ